MVSERALRGGICWLLLAMALGVAGGCGTRDRLTFPTEDPDEPRGPISAIIRPLAADTVVTRGDLIEIRGRTSDPDGVDTVYFELDGVNFSLSPIPALGLDTVEFSFELSTDNFVGDTAVLRVFGVDLPGSQGDFVSRRFRFR